MWAKTLVRTKDLSHEEWLAWRRRGLGGSDAAAVCGADPWKGPMDVYMDKLGEALSPPETEAMRLGKQMKDFIARRFMERTGLQAIRRHSLFQHPHHPFMLATIDRWLVGQQAGLLCKTAGEYRKDEWEQAVLPERIVLQCHHLMAVTGADHWWIAVLIGGNKFRTFRLEREERRITELIEKESRFWHGHVLSGRPPAWDGSPASSALLLRMFPPDETHSHPVALMDDAEDWIERYQRADLAEKAAVLQKAEAENRLKGMLGEHEQGVTSRHRVEWKTIRPRSGRQPAYRRFQIQPISK
ncbi:YqaJ viral recombinase family protein [Paenibacillus elgii]